MKKLLIALTALVFISGCAPEVGSDAWCQAQKEKDKGDWTANEAADYAQHCVFK